MSKKTLIAVGMITASLYAAQAQAVPVTYSFNFTTNGPDGVINPGSTTGLFNFQSIQDNTLSLTVRPSEESETLNINSNFLINNASGLGIRLQGDTGNGTVLNYSLTNGTGFAVREMMTMDLAGLNSQVFSTYGANITSYELFVTVVEAVDPSNVEAAYSLGGGLENALFINGLTTFSGNSLLRIYSPNITDYSIRVVSLNFTFDNSTPKATTPEPEMLGLLGFALAGLALMRRK